MTMVEGFCLASSSARVKERGEEQWRKNEGRFRLIVIGVRAYRWAVRRSRAVPVGRSPVARRESKKKKAEFAQRRGFTTLNTKRWKEFNT